MRSTRATAARADSASRFRRPQQRNRVLRRSRRRLFIRRSTRGLVFFLIGAAAAGWLGGAAAHWLTRTDLLAVRRVQLEDIRLADRAGMQRLLTRLHGRNLLVLDLADLRRELVQQDPWVADALVRRLFPHTVSIRLHERRPAAVAVLGGVPTLVDAEGEPIAPWTRRLGEVDLPLITGVPAGEPEARDGLQAGLAALSELAVHSRPILARLAEVDVGNDDRITVRLTDELAPLHLRREGVTLNLDHYFAVREDIRQRLGAVRAIDLRWRGRVVVVPERAEASGGRPHRPGDLTFGKAWRDG